MTKIERFIATRLLKVWVDKGYRGGLDVWFHHQWQIALDIVESDPNQKGFAVQPCQWVVERTFAWLGKYRRLSKDFEYDVQSSEGFIYLASIMKLLKRLGK